jgi:hypothetical protein
MESRSFLPPSSLPLSRPSFTRSLRQNGNTNCRSEIALRGRIERRTEENDGGLEVGKSTEALATTGEWMRTKMEKMFNELGAEGWEYSGDKDDGLIFKRRKS